MQCDYTGGVAKAMKGSRLECKEGQPRRGHEREWRQGVQSGQAPPPRGGGYIGARIKLGAQVGATNRSHKFKAGQDRNPGQRGHRSSRGPVGGTAAAAAGGEGVGAAVAPARMAHWGFKATAASQGRGWQADGERGCEAAYV